MGVLEKIMLTVIFVIDVGRRGPVISRGCSKDSTTHSRETVKDEPRIQETKEEISTQEECTRPETQLRGRETNEDNG